MTHQEVEPTSDDRESAALELILRTTLREMQDGLTSTDEAIAHQKAIQEALRSVPTEKELEKARNLKRLKRCMLVTIKKLADDFAKRPWEACRPSDEEDLTDMESVAD
jgi:hypothetical protein